jgi:hypothetical protein
MTERPKDPLESASNLIGAALLSVRQLETESGDSLKLVQVIETCLELVRTRLMAVYRERES